MTSVCVFCSSRRGLDPELLDIARRTGELIAAGGHTLVFGGGRTGMMGVLADAARAGGAATIGVTAEMLTEAEAADVGSDTMIVTADLAGRKAAMIEKADVFVVLPGGLGTLDEMFEVWTTGPQLALHDKRMVVVNEHGFFDGLLHWLSGLSARGLIRPELLEALIVAGTVDEALDHIG